MTANLGLLTRVQKVLPYPYPFPNITLQADWDVTNEIVSTLQSMTIQPQLEHVKGHQDDHTTYGNLSLEAQLNDKEAGLYQSTFPAYRPIIPRLPSIRAQLHTDNKVISSNLQQSIRKA